VATSESDLAWDLASALESVLTAADRTLIFAKIGAGEVFGAIGDLLVAAQNLSPTFPPELLLRASTWLDAYIGSDDETRLRELLERLRGSK
jgi:hypothetical protein